MGGDPGGKGSVRATVARPRRANPQSYTGGRANLQSDTQGAPKGPDKSALGNALGRMFAGDQALQGRNNHGSRRDVAPLQGWCSFASSTRGVAPG